MPTLKKFLTNAFETQSFDETRDTHTGFNRHSIRGMFAYLYGTFEDESPL